MAPGLRPFIFLVTVCGPHTDSMLDLTGSGFPLGWGPSQSDCIFKETFGCPCMLFSSDDFSLMG